MIYMHRQIMQPPPGMIVDHISGNGFDNTRLNLRNATPRENVYDAGKPVGGTSIYKGVCYNKRLRKWNAYISFRGKRFHLGTFGTEEEARAYDRRAVELWGEHARPNFPEEWPPRRRARVHARYQASLEKEGEKTVKGEKGLKSAKGVKVRKEGGKRAAAGRATPHARRSGARDRRSKRKTRDAERREDRNVGSEEPGRRPRQGGATAGISWSAEMRIFDSKGSRLTCP